MSEGLDDKRVEGLVAQAPASLSVQASKFQSVETSRRQDVKAFEHLDVTPSRDVPAVVVERPSDPQPPPVGSSFVQRKRDGVVRKRMTIYLTPGIAKGLAMRSVETDKDMSELVEEALGLFLKR